MKNGQPTNVINRSSAINARLLLHTFGQVRTQVPRREQE